MYINTHSLTHTCFCCVSDLPGNIAWSVWMGRSLVDGESWLRDNGLRLAVCSVFPPGHSHSKCVCDRLTAPSVHLLPPTTSRNRKSGMFLRAVVTGPDKIERYRARERGNAEEEKGQLTFDPPDPSGPLVEVPGLAWQIAGLLPAASDSTPTSPLSLCLCERTRDGHHTYTTAEIWPRLQTERLEEENFTTLSHLLFLYLLYWARTHTQIHTHRHFDEQRLCQWVSVCVCVCVCVCVLW